MINYIDLCILLFVLYLQIKNLLKYRATNGAQRTRIILLVSVICLVIHIIRLILGVTTGIFLLLHVVTWLILYEGDKLDWLLDKIKKGPKSF